MKLIVKSNYCLKLLFLLILTLPLLTQAAVYKHVDDEGRLIKYSDQPQKPGDKPIKMSKPAMEFESKTPAKKAKPNRDANKPKRKEREQEEKKAVVGYSAVAILKPDDEQAIRANGGSFPIEVVSQPALDAKSGHRYVIMVDGEKHAQSGNSKFNLNNMERGTHSISAEIHDKDGNALASSSSKTIYVLRAFRR